MSDKEKAIIILMAMATLFGHINIKESTRNMNTLLGFIRKGLTKLMNSNMNQYVTLAKEANRIWSDINEKNKNEERTITIEETAIALFAILEGNKYKNIWFTDKAFNKAMGSYYNYVAKGESAVSNQEDSNILADGFQEALGLNKQSKLSAIKKNIYNHLVLEGKIK